MLKNIYLSKKILFAFIVLILAKTAVSQSQTSDNIRAAQDLMQLSEKIYGVDDRIINGEFYQNVKIILKGHPNFMNDIWAKGPVYVKNDCFENVNIKYNIELDKMILLAQFSSGNIMQLSLNDNYIDSLYVHDHLLINASIINPEFKGFYEPVFTGNIKAYFKHKKYFVEKTSTSAQGSALKTGGYRNQITTLYIYKDDELTKITSRKSLISLFEEHEKEIKRIVSRDKINFRKPVKSQLINLLKYCDEISSEPNE